MTTPPFDLQQVGKLFKDTIAILRDDTLDVEPQAIAWLKAARYKLMRDLEKEYYALERSRTLPLLRPDWALDPSKRLVLITHDFPAVLAPYSPAIEGNLLALLDASDCGRHCNFITERTACGGRVLAAGVRRGEGWGVLWPPFRPSAARDAPERRTISPHGTSASSLLGGRVAEGASRSWWDILRFAAGTASLPTPALITTNGAVLAMFVLGVAAWYAVLLEVRDLRRALADLRGEGTHS
ncbi:hypothetical protein C8R46DRAFT_1233775 [Mycena filopes]|nr:hypothetical protein C8R46DRAFT_1233775 [Mycena filopes]